MSNLKKFFIFFYVVIMVISINILKPTSVDSQSEESSYYITDSINYSINTQTFENVESLDINSINVKKASSTSKSTTSWWVNFWNSIKNIFAKIKPVKNPTPTTTTKKAITTTTKAVTSNQNAQLIYNNTFLTEAATKINTKRSGSNIQIDADLAKVAAVRAKELASQYSSTRPNGKDYSTAYSDANVSKPTYTAECITSSSNLYSAAHIVNIWLCSNSDSSKILNNTYTRFGMAWYIAPNGNQYAVIELGSGAASSLVTTTKASTTKKVTTTTKAPTTTVSNKKPAGTLIYNNSNYSNFTTETANAVNKARRNAGLSDIKFDANLSSVAAVRAKEIKNYFSHTRPDGRKSYTVYYDLGISKPTSVAENIATATRFENATDIINVWLNSPDHRALILSSKYTRFGVAWYVADNGKEYAVMELGNG